MSEELKGNYPHGVNDEYAALLDFIRAQKTAGGDDEGEDGTRIVKKRELLRPWVVKEVRVNKNGEEETIAAKVPASW